MTILAAMSGGLPVISTAWSGPGDFLAPENSYNLAHSAPIPEYTKAGIIKRYSMRRAFTILELLVVLGVVGMLLALLLPALKSANQRAYDAVCKSNLKQLAIALEMYVTDCAGEYPPAYDYTDRGTSVGRTMWSMYIKDYIYDSPLRSSPWYVSHWYYTNKVGVHMCPSTAKLIWRTPGFPMVGYGYNTGLKDDFTDGLSLGGRMRKVGNKMTVKATREGDVRMPAQMLSFGDGVIHFFDTHIPGIPAENPIAKSGFSWVNQDLGHTALSSGILLYLNLVKPLNGDTVGPTEIKLMKYRHWPTWNVAFCDSHVESRTVEGLFDYHNLNVLSNWRTDHEPHRELLPATLP